MPPKPVKAAEPVLKQDIPEGQAAKWIWLSLGKKDDPIKMIINVNCRTNILLMVVRLEFIKKINEKIEVIKKEDPVLNAETGEVDEVYKTQKHERLDYLQNNLRKKLTDHETVENYDIVDISGAQVNVQTDLNRRLHEVVSYYVEYSLGLLKESEADPAVKICENLLV